MSTKYSEKVLAGLESSSRSSLAKLLRASKGTISVSQASEAWGISKTQAAKKLAQFSKGGWLSRVHQGLYVPVAIESETPAPMVEDPWIIAKEIFRPCYIGGWSAAEYWELTEQLFRETMVLTTRRPQVRQLSRAGAEYRVKTIKARVMFGITEIWRGNIRVPVSSAAKTVVDMLDDPALGGGIRPVTDVLSAYLNSKSYNAREFQEICGRFDSGAVFKRLGFLLERNLAPDLKLIDICKAGMTKGTAKLDPSLGCPRLVTKWRLWVPENWKASRND